MYFAKSPSVKMIPTQGLPLSLKHLTGNSEPDWVAGGKETAKTNVNFFFLTLLRDLAPIRFELFSCLCWFLLSAFPGKSTKDFVDLKENS